MREQQSLQSACMEREVNVMPSLFAQTHIQLQTKQYVRLIKHDAYIIVMFYAADTSSNCPTSIPNTFTTDSQNLFNVDVSKKLLIIYILQTNADCACINITTSGSWDTQTDATSNAYKAAYCLAQSYKNRTKFCKYTAATSTTVCSDATCEDIPSPTIQGDCDNYLSGCSFYKNKCYIPETVSADADCADNAKAPMDTRLTHINLIEILAKQYILHMINIIQLQLNVSVVVLVLHIRQYQQLMIRISQHIVQAEQIILDKDVHSQLQMRNAEALIAKIYKINPLKSIAIQEHQEKNVFTSQAHAIIRKKHVQQSLLKVEMRRAIVIKPVVPLHVLTFQEQHAIFKKIVIFIVQLQIKPLFVTDARNNCVEAGTCASYDGNTTAVKGPLADQEDTVKSNASYPYIKDTSASKKCIAQVFTDNDISAMSVLIMPPTVSIILTNILTRNTLQGSDNTAKQTWYYCVWDAKSSKCQERTSSYKQFYTDFDCCIYKQTFYDNFTAQSDYECEFYFSVSLMELHVLIMDRIVIHSMELKRHAHIFGQRWPVQSHYRASAERVFTEAPNNLTTDADCQKYKNIVKQPIKDAQISRM
ncbi:unnamed protein product [Paramecium primaurelia]|uniref:Uncharacterized protein n=1 Tax=Paramecium primaurelia TaxID=5886 RepID=A0A8S1QRX3_PARPR|nr:unnamed protein product [Paramecium primaurelia]